MRGGARTDRKGRPKAPSFMDNVRSTPWWYFALFAVAVAVLAVLDARFGIAGDRWHPGNVGW